jgi:hypothetical protein
VTAERRAALIDDLAYIRQFVGLSDSELAELCGVSADTVRGWFDGGEIPRDLAPRIQRVAQEVRRHAADPTRLDTARRLTEPRPELNGRSILRAVADGHPVLPGTALSDER